MKVVLVTGGAGFIGSHLCQALLQDKKKVICIDNLVTGSLVNIKNLKEKPNFLFIKHDIVESLSLREKIDFIFNLASPASPVDYQKFPIETLLVNSLGVKNMLDLAVENKAQFLHTSTSEIYGEPEKHPQSENYWGNVNPIGSRSCYHEGKRFAESLIVSYQKKFGLDTKIVRIFNTYGPKMRIEDGRVVSNFVIQALRNQPLTVYGDGSQTRSFCYISDMVEGILKMAESQEPGPINLGNPEEIPVLALAKRILRKTGSKSKIVFKPLPNDDPTRRKPDITLAKTRLKWKPKVSLDEGLKKTIEYFRKIL